MANINCGKLTLSDGGVTDDFIIDNIKLQNNYNPDTGEYLSSDILAHYKDLSNNQFSLPLSSGKTLDTSLLNNKVMVGFQNSNKIIIVDKNTSITLPTYSSLGYASNCQGYNSNQAATSVQYTQNQSIILSSSMMLYPIYKFEYNNIVGSLTTWTGSNTRWHNSTVTNLKSSKLWNVTYVGWNYSCSNPNSNYTAGAVVLYNNSTRVSNQGDLQANYSNSSGTSSFSNLNYSCNKYVMSVAAVDEGTGSRSVTLSNLVISGWRLGNS